MKINQHSESMKKSSAALFLFIAFFSYAEGAIVTGNKLYSDLSYEIPKTGKTDPSTLLANSHKLVSALGYIQGVYDLNAGVSFSSFDDINVSQLKDIVLNYLREHPESRHQNAAGLVLKAYEEAFPLRSSSR
jgi:hypothetical protein